MDVKILAVPIARTHERNYRGAPSPVYYHINFVGRLTTASLRFGDIYCRLEGRRARGGLFCLRVRKFSGQRCCELGE